jgi:hypothetical protein
MVNRVLINLDFCLKTFTVLFLVLSLLIHTIDTNHHHLSNEREIATDAHHHDHSHTPESATPKEAEINEYAHMGQKKFFYLVDNFLALSSLGNFVLDTHQYVILEADGSVKQSDLFVYWEVQYIASGLMNPKLYS